MKLMEHFGRYGPPKQILTDRGAQFVNKLVKTVCTTYGVNFRTTPIAYSHERNAKVENANLQVLRHLRAYLFDQRVMEGWTRALPAVQFIFNSTIHRDIGYSFISPTAIWTSDEFQSFYLRTASTNDYIRRSQVVG